jgi:hypothetical protein
MDTENSSTQSMSYQSVFKPKEDITAYELAQLLPYMLGLSLDEAKWKALGTAVRHLERTKQNV